MTYCVPSRSRVFSPAAESDVFDRWVAKVFEQNDSIAPLTNVTEDEKNIYVVSQIPGFSKDQIEIEYQNQILNITANQETRTEQKEPAYRLREFKQNRVERHFRIGEVNFTEAKADYVNGELHITLPKTESSLPKKLQVQ